MTADDLGQGQRGGAMTALAENHILSKCSLIVPTDPSSFLGIAAQRAAASDDSVRAAMACPATSPAVRKSTSELGYCGGLHAIEPTRSRRRRRVDGLETPRHRADAATEARRVDGVGRPTLIPHRSPMASPFSATGDPCPCFFATRCPAPGSNFSRQLVHYGFAPDTGRASKHHSYEDHGSKPECPGLHE